MAQLGRYRWLSQLRRIHYTLLLRQPSAHTTPFWSWPLEWSRHCEIEDFTYLQLDILSTHPFQLVLGNFGLSYEQSKSQLAVWTVLAAPLLLSNDLATVTPEIRELLLNKEIIAANQDPLGIQGLLVKTINRIEVSTGYQHASQHRPFIHSSKTIGDNDNICISWLSLSAPRIIRIWSGVWLDNS